MHCIISSLTAQLLVGASYWYLNSLFWGLRAGIGSGSTGGCWLYALGLGILYLSRLSWDIGGRFEKSGCFFWTYVVGLLVSNNLYYWRRLSRVEWQVWCAYAIDPCNFPPLVVILWISTPSEVDLLVLAPTEVSGGTGIFCNIGSIGEVVSRPRIWANFMMACREDLGWSPGIEGDLCSNKWIRSFAVFLTWSSIETSGMGMYRGINLTVSDGTSLLVSGK